MIKMDLQIDSGWKLHPIGGDTGQAYMGTKEEEKVFLKRNSSPFLAALSVEGITPKLVWTKRIGNGDVLTAQEWMNGRTLKSSEMSSTEVAQLLSKVHHSKTLKRMLSRVGGKTIGPLEWIDSYFENLSVDLKEHPFLQEVAVRLKNTVPSFSVDEFTVCHGDVYRKNWLLSDADRLYLVDWDSAMLCDPALDLGVLLCQYVKKESWLNWLEYYGQEMTEELSKRMIWYASLNYLLQIKKHHREAKFHKMNQEIIRLQNLVLQYN